MGRRKKKILREITKKLEEHEPVFRARIVAAIVHKGKIISFGKNQNKTHPDAAFYSKHDEAIYLHAEVDAINKAKKKLSAEELSSSSTELYIVRMKQNGTLGLSLPCSGCSRCISDHGIDRVVYSNSYGEMECI